MLEHVSKFNVYVSLPDIQHRAPKDPKCEVVEAEAKRVTSSQTATVPEDWQVSDVTHKYEKSSEGNPKNHRLANLASFPSIHLAESLIKDEITEIMKTWINIVF